MSESLGCVDCHGDLHKSNEDIVRVQLPTIATCEACHSEQAGQYLSGKHALGLVSLEAMPYTHSISYK